MKIGKLNLLITAWKGAQGAFPVVPGFIVVAFSRKISSALFGVEMTPDESMQLMAFTIGLVGFLQMFARNVWKNRNLFIDGDESEIEQARR